jgi:hypothetical protein
MVMTTATWRILKLTAARLRDDPRVTVKGVQLVIDAAALDDREGEKLYAAAVDGLELFAVRDGYGVMQCS